jgi:hypothetical protein
MAEWGLHGSGLRLRHVPISCPSAEITANVLLLYTKELKPSDDL